jgi:hypothetical protein
MPTLVPLETAAIDPTMLHLSAAGTDETSGPTSLFESGLALLLGAVQLEELGKGHPWLELDAAGNHDGYWCLRTAVAVKRASAEVPAESSLSLT